MGKIKRIFNHETILKLFPIPVKKIFNAKQNDYWSSSDGLWRPQPYEIDGYLFEVVCEHDIDAYLDLLYVLGCYAKEKQGQFPLGDEANA